MVVVEFEGKEKRVSPEEVSSMVLMKMKDVAERFLGRPMKNAVVTVPAYFNHSQREATKKAGAMAGLNVLRIINKPTAAAIAYFLENKITISGMRNVIIFDLGGGTLDVSLVTVGEGKFEVKATAGDTHLGGEDFDNRLLSYFVDEIKRKQNKDITGDPRKLRMIRTACERAKRNLSFQTKTRVDIDLFFDDVNYTIVRAKFEELCGDLFKKCMQPIEQCLADAKIGKNKIDEVVLVGGSSRIPKIQQLLRDCFGEKELNMTVNCDEAVAYGAAVQAAMLSGEGNKSVPRFILSDVIPLSLGVNKIGGIMDVMIPRNSPIPFKKEKWFSTAYDNQKEAFIEIFEGESVRSRKNNLLGSFTISGITPAPRGVSEVKVCFEIDADGILHVLAEHSSGGVTKKLSITKDEVASKAVVERMVAEADEFKDEDQQLNSKIRSLLDYVDDMIKMGRKLNKSDEEDFKKAIDDVIRWVGEEKFSITELEQKQEEMEELCAKFSLMG